MRIAAIDIGTNTVLMLLAETVPRAIRRVLRDEHSIARLGKGVDQDRRILPEAVDRVARVLMTYRGICDEEGAEKIVACGTSAFRDAANRTEVTAALLSRTGITVRVLTGVEEAELTYRGTLAGTGAAASGELVSVLDIGGGSTEVICGSGLSVLKTTSVDIGAVRVTERFLRDAPPGGNELERANDFCRQAFDRIDGLMHTQRCFAVAVTPTTLAALALQLPAYDRTQVEGFILTRRAIEEFYNELRVLSHAQLLAIPQIHPQRADILVAGVLILRAYLDVTGTSSITVSDRGLRYGILLDSLEHTDSR